MNEHFNIHNNRTADGQLIVPGLKVFNNNLEVCEILSDPYSDYLCCKSPGSPGQVQNEMGWFTDHNSVDCGCKHNHWFETTKGSFDGERLATIFEGKDASSE